MYEDSSLKALRRKTPWTMKTFGTRKIFATYFFLSIYSSLLLVDALMEYTVATLMCLNTCLLHVSWEFGLQKICHFFIFFFLSVEMERDWYNIHRNIWIHKVFLDYSLKSLISTTKEKMAIILYIMMWWWFSGLALYSSSKGWTVQILNVPTSCLLARRLILQK